MGVYWTCIDSPALEENTTPNRAGKQATTSNQSEMILDYFHRILVEYWVFIARETAEGPAMLFNDYEESTFGK